MELKSKTLFKEVRSVFIFSEMHALIARLSVLYEDLRIEMFGVIEESIPALDYTDEKYRKNYFLRRSIATLIEVAEAFRMLNACSDFERIKAEFDKTSLIRWKRALWFFDKFEPFLKKVRNDIGGHFGHPAARYAIQNMGSSVVGKIEIATEKSLTGVKLHFAGEIAVYAMVRHKGDKSPEDFVRYLIRIISIGYRQAFLSIDSINAYYLWPKFGG